jgi:hypothetical protein
MAKVCSVRTALLAVVTLTAACTIKETNAPPLTGPSEFALSISVHAVPDTVTRNGSSQSTIVVTARDVKGSPVSSLELRADMIVLGQIQDFGTLSMRTLFTLSDGRATTVYTAPPAPPVGTSPVTDRVVILIRPVGTNQQTAVSHTVEIRLVLPTTSTPGAPVAFFTYSPSAPKVLQLILFNASGSYPVTGTKIKNYAWDWGDGSPLDGTNATSGEDHDYAAAGTYLVTLTVTDDLEQKGSTTQAITVSP